MVVIAQPAAADPSLLSGAASLQVGVPFGANATDLTSSADLPGLSAKKDPLTGFPILDAGLADWRNAPMVASVTKAAAPEVPAWLLVIGGLGLMAVFLNSRRRRLNRR